MDDLKWLDFLDWIAIEKKLTTRQKITLKAKFPTFNGIVNDNDAIQGLKLTGRDTLSSRLGTLYKIFGIEGDGKDKAIELQEHLQQESLNWLRKQEQDSIDPPPTSTTTTQTPPQPRKLFGNANLPIPNWVGREELLIELHTELENNRRVLVLCGQGGIGKTSLAVKLMAAGGIDISKSELLATCPYDNVLFYQVGESDSFESLVTKFLNAFGLAPNRDATPAQKIDSIVERLHQQRWLVVLDNLESLMEFDSAKSKSADVGDLLNALAYGGHNSQIVITSRKLPEDLYDRRGRGFNPGIVFKKDIPGISDAASIQLLKDLGLQDSEEDLAWIAGRVKGNVLILEQLAKYAEYPEQLRQERDLVTNEANPVVRAQWEKQGAAAQELLERMCVLRIRMDAAALTTLRLLQPDGEVMEWTKEAQKVTVELLAGLENSGLVESTYDKSACKKLYVLHRLIAETLQAIFEDDLKLLWHYAAKLYRSFDRSQEFRSFDDLKFVLEELHFYWFLGTIDEYVMSRVIDILPKLRKWCYRDLPEEWLQNILEVQTKLGRAEIASLWGILGDIARQQENYDNAEDHYHRFLAISNELGDLAGMASALGCLEDIARKQGNYDKAEALRQKSQEVYTNLEADQMPKFAELMFEMAKLYRANGDNSKAQMHYLISHDSYTKLGAKEDLERIESKWNVDP